MFLVLELARLKRIAMPVLSAPNWVEHEGAVITLVIHRSHAGFAVVFASCPDRRVIKRIDSRAI